MGANTSSLAVTIGITVGVPWAIRYVEALRSHYVSRKQRGPPQTGGRLAEPSPRPPAESSSAARRRLILLLLMIGFSIGQLVLQSPIDAFTSLGLSVTVPASTVRRAFIMAHGDPLPVHAQRTLSYLSTLDNRLAYLRYGEDAAFNPLCAGPSGAQFRIFVAMARRMGSYAFAAAVIGVLTETGGRQRWRKTLAFAVIAGWVGESWALSTGRWDREAKIDLILHLTRWTAFAFLSIVAYFVPARSVPPSAPEILGPQLATILTAQQSAQQRLLVLSITRDAILRDPVLRDRFVESWKTQAEASGRARSSPAAAAVRKRIGLVEGGGELEQLNMWLNEFVGMPGRAPSLSTVVQPSADVDKASEPAPSSEPSLPVALDPPATDPSPSAATMPDTHSTDTPADVPAPCDTASPAPVASSSSPVELSS